MRKQAHKDLLMNEVLLYIQGHEGKTNGMWKHLQSQHGEMFTYLQMRDMIQSLVMTGDIRKIYGFTRSSKYEITASGRKKLGT